MKVLILDGNPDVTSKAGLFKSAWAEEYKGIVEYRPNHVMTDVDWRARPRSSRPHDDVKADVLNAVPPQRASNIARAGRRDHRERSLVRCRLRDLRIDQGEEHPRARRCDPARAGDAEVRAHGEPAREGLRGGGRRAAVGPAAESGAGLNNTCYSFITDKDVVHVASVHQYDREKKTCIAVQGAGGLSPAWTPLEGEYAFTWAQNIWADALA